MICELYKRTTLSKSKLREIFCTEYNLSFKKPKVDSCSYCDERDAILKSSSLSYEERNLREDEKRIHLEKVEKKKAEFDNDVEEAIKSDGKVVCITFDLQKTLETPVLTTSIAFYKRQLWTYNLGVYDEGDRRGFMYVWPENMAGRGADEVGSCLLQHIKENVTENTRKIILYSDKCGGQNRNIKITLLLKKLLSTSRNLIEIQQFFFISGHSMNSCDRCFALIEQQKKKTSTIFTPDHWIQLISQAKKTSPKFTVTKMKPEYFVSSKQIMKLITNRKKTINKEKFSWLEIDSIFNKKKHPFILYIKSMEATNLIIVDLQKRNVTEKKFARVRLQNLEEKQIKKEKYFDLISLLRFIPIEYHEFYRNLKYSTEDNENDYGLASDQSDTDEDG